MVQLEICDKPTSKDFAHNWFFRRLVHDLLPLWESQWTSLKVAPPYGFDKLATVVVENRDDDM